MTLIRLDETGAHPVQRVPDDGRFRQYKRSAPQKLQIEVGKSIIETLGRIKHSGHTGFCLRTHFAESSIIEHIYELYNDQAFSAQILAFAIMENLIIDTDEWRCAKLNMVDREFETNYYWLSG